MYLVEVWPSSGPPDQPWHPDPDLDAFIRATRGICELYSEALRAQRIVHAVSSLRLLPVDDRTQPGAGAANEITVSVSEERPVGSEFGRVHVAPGYRRLASPERRKLAEEAIYAAVSELAQIRGWGGDTADLARNHVLDAEYVFKWDSKWKASPDRRHRARARYSLADDGVATATLASIFRYLVTVP